MRFNVALAACMELTGHLERRPHDERDLRTLVLLLAPLAPHLAEELWSRMGGEGSVHVARWPEPSGTDAPTDVDLAVQVDGRFRDRVRLPTGSIEADVVAAALSSEKVRRALDGREVVRIVYVPGRLLNLVR